MLRFCPNIRFVAFILSTLVLPASSRAVDFAHEVMPIIKRRCGKCHTGSKKEGGLSMNTRALLLAGGEGGKVIFPGDAAKGAFMEQILSNDEDAQMPPEGPRVPVAEIVILKQWVSASMPWDEGVVLGKSAWEPPLKPRQVRLPPAQNDRGHPIDRLLDNDLAKHEQEVPPPVSDAVFLRRASLDVIGLLPSPEQLQQFVADPATNKREKLIDKLLADDIAYADHWLTTWNDLLRNDYTGTGFITGGRRQITTWLYSSLRDNIPYDQFVRELIAPTQESSGFIDGIKWRGEVNASQTRDIQFAQNVSQVFLGINMKCASCHDSFIDRWTLSEAYNLAAIYSEKPLELNRCDKPTGKMATPKWIFPEIGDVDPKAPKAERLKQLAALMTHADNGRFTRTVVNRLWDRLMGRGIVHPVDAMHTQPWNEDLLDHLAVRFADDGYDLRKFIRFVMTSEAYQSRTAVLKTKSGEDYVYAGPIAKRMTAEQLIDAVWQITGTNPAKPTGKVDRAERKPATPTQPATNATLSPPAVTAKWIWYPGAVIKRTDLRKKFALSTKPKIAIMRATCDNAFAMKINGKAVASSKDWAAPVQVDITQSLAKGENVIEVVAEMFGGAAGFICQIDIIDGETQRNIVTDKTWEAHKSEGKWMAAAEMHPHGAGPWGALLNKRGVSPQLVSSGRPVRAALVKNDFLMRSLGRPHRDQVVTTRPAELTTLQAIDLSNGDILAGYLSLGAKQTAAEGKSADQLIHWLYRFALSREPNAEELTILSEVVGDGHDLVAVEDLLWSVFMLPEFQFVR